MTRCVLESADKTNLSRFFSEAPWFHDRVNAAVLILEINEYRVWIRAQVPGS